MREGGRSEEEEEDWYYSKRPVALCRRFLQPFRASSKGTDLSVQTGGMYRRQTGAVAVGMRGVDYTGATHYCV